jgi:hypothetical protein
MEMKQRRECVCSTSEPIRCRNAEVQLSKSKRGQERENNVERGSLIEVCDTFVTPALKPSSGAKPEQRGISGVSGDPAPLWDQSLSESNKV